MGIDELKKRIEKSGIVGAGGAGFPTHLKIDPRTKTILLNCAECEPLVNVDQHLLTAYTREILSALNTVAETLRSNAVIAVKQSYKKAIDAVRAHISGYPRMRLALPESTYPAGDEILLIYEALGILIQPGTLPIESGCTVLNTETVYNIYNAVERSAAVTHKWVTVAGEVRRSITAPFPVGTTVAEAVEAAGGTAAARPAFILGGAMMGKPAAAEDKISKTTNAVFVLPEDHYLLRRAHARRSAELNRVASACCQCQTCTALCPRNLLGYPIEPHKIMRALALRDPASKAHHGMMYCSLCGVCEMYACPQSLSPRSLIGAIRANLAQAGICPAVCEANASPAFAYRKIQASRLTERLGLAKYEPTGVNT